MQALSIKLWDVGPESASLIICEPSEQLVDSLVDFLESQPEVGAVGTAIFRQAKLLLQEDLAERNEVETSSTLLPVIQFYSRIEISLASVLYVAIDLRKYEAKRN